jgi:DNA polymerase delta subunit 1
VYEEGVKPLTRFLCHAGLSGGSWVHVPMPRGGAGGDGGGNTNTNTTLRLIPKGAPGRLSTADVEAIVPWRCLHALTPDATQIAGWSPPQFGALESGGGTAAASASSSSPPLPATLLAALAAAKEGAILPLRALTLDVLVASRDGRDRCPVPRAGDPVVAIACLLSRDMPGGAGGGGGGGAGGGEAGSSGNGNNNHAALGLAPLPPSLHGVKVATAASAEVVAIDDSDEEEEDPEDLRGNRAAAATPTSAPGEQHQQRVVFMLAGAAGCAALADSGGAPFATMTLRDGDGASAAEGDGGGGNGASSSLRLFPSEAAMLLAWRDWAVAADPDALVVFRAQDGLGALAARFDALRLQCRDLQQHASASSAASQPPAGLQLGRLRASLPTARPLSLQPVTMYSAAWVRSQSRMSATSNQETFRVAPGGGCAGRIVFDVLRQVLSAHGLATFTLADCAASLLGGGKSARTLEVLPAWAVAALARQVDDGAVGPADVGGFSGGQGGNGGNGNNATTAPPPPPLDSAVARCARQRAAQRLARHALKRARCAYDLAAALATAVETYELSRATGLPLAQVLYNAQMVRTWSLLLRTARRRGYLVGGGGREPGEALVASPFNLHPVENRTTGLYRHPVAVCDFASLYPSLYRAHNLCYTTLVHAVDAQKMLGAASSSSSSSSSSYPIHTSPSGATFVDSTVRVGLLPRILAALVEARAATRAQLATLSSSDPATRGRRLVLDGRQRALKVTANALYGFTGATASPLQCAPLADACLSYGAAACRAAVETIGALAASGELGPAAEGGRVIYAQTDSVFVSLPRARTGAEAARVGAAAAAAVSRGLPPPMQLAFEKVYSPFLLVHHNRYAGRVAPTPAVAEEDESSGRRKPKIEMKGLKAIWRQSAPFVSRTLSGAVERLLLTPGGAVAAKRAAIAFVEAQSRRLLTGGVTHWDLTMTGGLWRVTGQQVAAAAAAIGGGGGGRGGGAAARAGRAGSEDEGGGDEDDAWELGGGAGAGGGPSPAAKRGRGWQQQQQQQGTPPPPSAKQGGGLTAATPPTPAAATPGGGGEDADVRGPHNALAVRLAARDPGRAFVLGERVPFVLLQGPAAGAGGGGGSTSGGGRGGRGGGGSGGPRGPRQDDQAEDPLTAAVTGAAPDTLLYFTHKLMPPLREVMALALTEGEMTALVSGPHTQSRATAPGLTFGAGGGVGGAGGSSAVASPATPGGGAPRPSGGAATSSPGAKRSLFGGGGGNAGRGQQSGLASFFRASARCLACKNVITGAPPPPSPSAGGAAPPAPALCAACRGNRGAWQAAFSSAAADRAAAERQMAACQPACARCHSAGGTGLGGPFLCANGECVVLHTRLDASRRAAAAADRLARLAAASGGGDGNGGGDDAAPASW